MINTEEILVIDAGHIWQSLKSKFKVILIATIGCACIAAAASVTIYHETYKSVGTLLYNPSEVTPTAGDVDSAVHFLKGQGIEISPYKNQEQLLRSKLIAERVFNTLRKNGEKLPVNKPEKLLTNMLSAEHVKGTDFIRVTATASNPKLAQKIAEIYIDNYLALINEISYAPLLQNKKLFEGQLHQAEKELAQINQKISAYQAQSGILNLEVESQDKVRELLGLASDAKTVEASLAQKKAEVSIIRQQLKLNHQDIGNVLQAVATGQNGTLNDLQEKLDEAQREYNTNALIYAPTNPDMVQLQQKINVLKRQMADQRILNVGNMPILKAPNLIKDSVRTDLVNRLAAAESEVAAYQSKLGTIRHQYQQMDATLQSLPKQELDYALLQLEKKSKEELFTRLKGDLTEIQIQEASIRKKLIVIDRPNLAERASFPRPIHIIGISLAASVLLSTLVITGLAICEPKRVRPEFIENILRRPLLAVIPWLPENKWQYYRNRNTLEVTARHPDLQLIKAYQNLALNLKVQCNISGKNTLAVSSMMKTAGASVILSNLAYCLAQSGDNVLLVDANFHKPRLHEAFNHDLNYEHGLPEVINDISEIMYHNPHATVGEVMAKVSSASLPTGIHSNLYYLNAGVRLENTFEFLNSKGFSALISSVKQQYDWVLVDAPPFLEHSDAAVLLSYVDGLLLLVEQDATETQITLVREKIQRLNADIIGAVLRDGSISK